MDTIRLRYNRLTTPVLADRDGEAVTNWETAGTHVVTADATHVYAGTNSFKIAASGTGDFTTNYANLPSGHMPTFTVAKRYCLTLRVYGESALTFQVKTGGVTSSTFTCTAGSFIACHFEFTASSAATALQIIVLAGGGSIWFELEQIVEYVNLNVLSERGVSDPDTFEIFPALQYTALDGAMVEYIKGFRRLMVIDCGVVASSADRKSILYWMIDAQREVDYLTETNVRVALRDIGGFENEWKYDCSLMRNFTFALVEPTVRTTFPV
jgi:hypothetical protein